MRIPLPVVVPLALATVGVTWWLGTRRLDFLNPPAVIPPQVSPVQPPPPSPSQAAAPLPLPPPLPPPPEPVVLQLAAPPELTETLAPLAKEAAALLTSASGGSLDATAQLAPPSNPSATAPAVPAAPRPIVLSLASARQKMPTSGIITTFTPDDSSSDSLRDSLLRALLRLLHNYAAEVPLPDDESPDPAAPLQSGIPTHAWQQIRQAVAPR